MENKKKFLIVLVCFLMSSVVYYGFTQYIFENERNCKKIIVRQYHENNIANLNLFFSQPQKLELSLVADSSVYFEEIAKSNKVYLKNLNKNSTICTHWSENIKEKYTSKFKEYIENNNTRDLCLDGVHIIDQLCR